MMPIRGEAFSGHQCSSLCRSVGRSTLPNRGKAFGSGRHDQRGKLKWPWLDIEATLTLVRSRSGRVRDISVLTHEAALALARDHSLAFYDALIVAAAIEAGCDTLFTEDMQHGRKFGSLAIVNPFIERAP
jgi:hypothetical protein